MLKVNKLIGSAYWASYFINNDASGLSAEEKSLADAWLDKELAAHESIVDCGEPYFSWSYGLYTGADCQGGDLIEYTTLRP